MTWKETKSLSHSQEKRNKKDPTFGIYQVKTLKEMFMFKKLKKFCLENEMQYGDKKSTNKRL